MDKLKLAECTHQKRVIITLHNIALFTDATPSRACSFDSVHELRLYQ